MWPKRGTIMPVLGFQIWQMKLWTSMWQDRWRGGIGRPWCTYYRFQMKSYGNSGNRSRNRSLVYQAKVERQANSLGPTAEVVWYLLTKFFDPTHWHWACPPKFASYKRPGPLIGRSGRFVRILTHPEHPRYNCAWPVRLPPFDESGKALDTKWVQVYPRT